MQTYIFLLREKNNKIITSCACVTHLIYRKREGDMFLKNSAQ